MYCKYGMGGLTDVSSIDPSSERNINGYTVRNTAGVTGYGNGDV